MAEVHYNDGVAAPVLARPAWPSSPWPFFLVTYLFSWLCFGAVLTLGERVDFAPPSLGLLLSVLGDFGPGVAAIVLTAIETGRTGVRAFLAQLARRPGARSLLVATLAVPLLVTAGNVLSLLSGASTPASGCV